MRFEIRFSLSGDAYDSLTLPEGKYNRQDVLDWLDSIEKRKGLNKGLLK